MRRAPARSADWRALLPLVNVPSREAGDGWSPDDRVRAVRALLAGTGWTRLRVPGPVLLYRAPGFDARADFVLLSSHLDSRYRRHSQAILRPGVLIGSFDNAVTNAGVLALMRQGRLPAQTLVAFCGGEERDFGGARRLCRHLRRERPSLWKRLILAVTIDVTDARYGRAAYTLENLFRQRRREPARSLRFRDKRALRAFLLARLPGAPVLVDAGPDESWEFAEHDLTCCSLCVPTAPHPDDHRPEVVRWMHASHGIRVREKDVDAWSGAVVRLCEGLHNGAGAEASSPARSSPGAGSTF
jgi:hypothetical protein